MKSTSINVTIERSILENIRAGLSEARRRGRRHEFERIQRDRLKSKVAPALFVGGEADVAQLYEELISWKFD
jgi:hypothetical protein